MLAGRGALFKASPGLGALGTTLAISVNMSNITKPWTLRLVAFCSLLQGESSVTQKNCQKLYLKSCTIFTMTNTHTPTVATSSHLFNPVVLKLFVAADPINCTQNPCGPLCFAKVFTIMKKLDLIDF